VPSGHCNVGVQIADHDHSFRHRDLHARGKCAQSLRAFVLKPSEPDTEHRCQHSTHCAHESVKHKFPDS
jgi:hypothetical protein